MTTHTLPPSLLDSLSGPGDAAEIDVLWSGQYSRRLVQLRAILDLVSRQAPDAGKRARLTDNFAALATVQRHAPTVVATLLSGPQAGAWAARCLRILAGTPSAEPLWAHLAHLGSLAITAAIRSTLDIEAHVPLRAGTLSLPALGQAHNDDPTPWTLATCTVSNPILINGSAPSDWHPLRFLETDTLSIPLDGTDPYWSCFNLPLSTHLTAPDLHRWHHHLTAAMAIIGERHPDRTATMAAIRCLVPVERGDRFGGVSASSRDAPGAVALTEPIRPDRLVATLVHEIQHFRLNALHDLVPLHRADAGALLYSPWRNDPRGLPGLLHATSAFLGVAQFWSREWPTAGRAAELMYGRTVRQLHAGHRVLSGSPELTPAGQALVAALDVAINRLPELELTGDIRRIATDLVTHHRALWRLRNVVPEPGEVDTLADEWRHGKPITQPSQPHERVTAATAPGGDSPLFRLATTWLEARETVLSAAEDPATFQEQFPGADPADLPLLTGNYAEVQRIRLTQIAEGTAGPECWASLSVAHARLCPDPSRSPLAMRPWVVRACWPQLATVSQDSLRALAARYMGGTSTSDSMRR